MDLRSSSMRLQHVGYNLVRWKWRRRARALFLVLVLSLSSLATPSNCDTSEEQRQQRIKNIWEELRPHEIQHIFGTTKEAQEVPKFELVSPRVVEGRRRRRREKHISLSALGRTFSLTLSRNGGLKHEEAPYLFRQDNGTTVLPDTVLNGQLRCFYQGKAVHGPLAGTKGVTKTGLAALDLCDNGVKGLILSPDDPYHHYVIHPVPSRLSAARDHFIWRRTIERDNEQEPTSGSSCRHAHGPTTSGHKFRPKRSQADYKSLPADSYWLRYRTTTFAPSLRPHYGSSSRSEFPDYWAKSMLAYDAEPSPTSYHGRGFNTTASTSAYNYYGDQSPRSSTVSSTRKGRRDDRIFGEPWHSDLDSEIMSMAQSSLVPAPAAPQALTIETAVFVDKDLYKHMETNFPADTQAEVARIVLAMINAVQLLYQDPSLGHSVSFVLKRLEVLETDPPGLVRPYDIDRFLTNFCKWQKSENPASDADPLHWDHALILTGLDLYVVHQSGKISNQVVGLAPVAGMCTRSSSCTVNEGRHFESVYVVAHEIGHNLGMRHDGLQADNECDPSSHIMSPTLGSGKLSWSPCSKRYLDLFLQTPQSKCLQDRAVPEAGLDHESDGRLPGERFDADRQCVLKYGRGSYHATQQPIEDVCRDLHCRREHYTWTSHPALEGTNCGIDMSCRAGKCVERSGPGQDLSSNHLTAAYALSLKALDGAWGQWSPYTDCSSACLFHSEPGAGNDMSSTGIRLAARRCDSPRPENGGMQCLGSDRRYKSCRADKICPVSAGRTSVSQYANEVCTRAASVDTELSGRGFMTSTSDPERACSVWCETGERTGSRSRGWSFPDGTACKLTNQHHGTRAFCVAGKCQDFTCNPNTNFLLSDEDCVPQSDKPWLEHKRTGKAGWSTWETQTSCKLTCLAPAKGLELVERKCGVGDHLCPGLALSVRLCKPDKLTILANGCTRLQTAFEFATKVCTKYSEKVSGLSGIGMQLSSTKEDPDRPCRIGCQDAALPYRFYMVNGEEGWFPPGTDCSRGDPNKKAYCLGGKCVDFGKDDTPMYTITSKLFGNLESIFTHRVKRSYADPPHLDQSSLRDLVEHFSAGRYQEAGFNRMESPLDFNRPVLIQEDQLHSIMNTMDHNSASTSFYPQTDNGIRASQAEPMEGSFYEWRKIVSDCSVSCGQGLQEVFVECISGQTPVDDSLCAGRPRPGVSGYSKCERPACKLSRSAESPLWKWLQLVIPRRHEQNYYPY